MSVSARLHQALWDAADRGEARQVGALLAKGACPWLAHAPSGQRLGFSPLERAAFHGHRACVETIAAAETELLAQGFDPSRAKAWRRWPFLKGRSVGSQPNALARAAEAGRVELLPLLARHCDPEARDLESLRAIDRAALEGQLSACEFLAKVCDPLAIDRSGLTALMHCARSPKPESVRALAFLISLGGADKFDRSGRNALDWAAGVGSVPKCKILAQVLPVDHQAHGSFASSALADAARHHRLDALGALADACPDDSLERFAQWARADREMTSNERRDCAHVLAPRLLARQELRELQASAQARAKPTPRL